MLIISSFGQRFFFFIVLCIFRLCPIMLSIPYIIPHAVQSRCAQKITRHEVMLSVSSYLRVRHCLLSSKFRITIFAMLYDQATPPSTLEEQGCQNSYSIFTPRDFCIRLTSSFCVSVMPFKLISSINYDLSCVQDSYC